MWWFLGALIIVGILASSISGASKKNAEIHEKSEKNRLIEARARAYADYLRRTSGTSAIHSMSDAELIEHVTSAIRGYTKETEETTNGLGLFAGGAIILAIFVGASGAPPIVAILIAGGGIWFLYGQYKKEIQKIDESYTSKGFELDRLKIQ